MEDKSNTVSQMKENEFLLQLIKKTKVTTACRFEASRRMNWSKRISTISVSMLSIYIIGINLLVFLPSYQNDEKATIIITLTTVILSVFVLAISLVINQMQYGEKELIYHTCGMELNRYLDELLILRSEETVIDLEKKKILVKRYNDILANSCLNHTQLDKEIAVNRSSFVKSMQKYDSNWEEPCFIEFGWKLFRKYVLDASAIYLSFILFPPIIIIHLCL